jgi:YHS domain-containing protein
VVVALLGLVGSTGLSLAARQPAASAPAEPKSEPVRNIAVWNVEKTEKAKDGLAIHGYDPVAYFPEGGGKAAKGDASITTSYKGVEYRFVSREHRDTFLANPARYEPAFGGWCAWAMLDGDKVDVDPESFLVTDNRLFLFYKGFWGDTKAKWSEKAKDQASEAKQADGKWKDLSGEAPRDVKAASDKDAKAPAQGQAPAGTSGK